MLELKQIKEYFDPDLARVNPKGMLVEYLQYEYLDSLYKLAGSENLSFIGGTAIRIIHDSRRFSEDLDFDNFGLNYRRFRELINKANKEMATKGFDIEVKFLEKGRVFHCYVRFPDLLFKLGVSPHREEKVFISIDAEEKRKIFQPEKKTLNRFGVFRHIIVNPSSILLSQKLMTILLRKREKGRDFYDASFLAGKTKPDYDYIKKTCGLKKEEFIGKITRRCSALNYKSLAKEAEAFLFDADQTERILAFKDALPGILTA